MDKKILKRFGKDLEQFEIAKLRRKYEKLGYVFRDDFFPESHSHDVHIDAYAQHPISKDEIIFEIKSQLTILRGDKNRIIMQRRNIAKYYPNARFILVIAREIKEPLIDIPDLNDLLLNYISTEYIKRLKSTIHYYNRMESIEEISYEKLVHKNFRIIEVIGYANLKFWIDISEKHLSGEILTDGIPIKFHLFLDYSKDKTDVIPILNESSKIDFDFTEFENRNER
jgi:hypothetical protein